MGALTRWVSRRKGRGTTRQGGDPMGEEDDTDAAMPSVSGMAGRKAQKKKRVQQQHHEVELSPEEEEEEEREREREWMREERERERVLGADELWESTQARRRHPLGFVLAPTKAYALEQTTDAAWLQEQSSVAFKIWPVFASAVVDLLANAYTEPVYSPKRTVHALTFSCQVCTLLLTVTSFVVLVGGSDASTGQADRYLRVFHENRLMLLCCMLNVLAMCACRILKLVLLFRGNPHAVISQRADYRALFASHQLVSALYYVSLFQSVFHVCRHYCVKGKKELSKTRESSQAKRIQQQQKQDAL